MARPTPGLPSREQLLDFIKTSDTPAGKREIARAFGLHGADKIALKALLKDMADEGLIDGDGRRAFHRMGGVPRVTVLRVVDVDDGGNVWAVPDRWEAEGVPEPRLRLRERKGSTIGIGARVLARTEEAGAGWIAHPMKVLPRGQERIMGVLRAEGSVLLLASLDKRERRDWIVSDAGGASVGELVVAERAGRPPRVTARVVERLGDPFAPRSLSLVAIARHGLPHVFSGELLDEATAAAARDLGPGREDLRHLPIVAIDPVDARDHDDAVWAAPNDAGGWDAVVAIADVSFYVRPGSVLDREARARGNSVYFPDRVVPMLPEILSADVCSLKEGVDRAALACHLRIAADGEIASFRFARATVRIAANIAYEDAQAAIDGAADHPLTDAALRPLWDCWRALDAARGRREPLALDLPERRVVLGEDGSVASVAVRERLDAHRLIEDFMIAANVAAARAFEARRRPTMYRVHEPPARGKLVALKEYLKTLGHSFALGQVVRPATFNRLIDAVGDSDYREQAMEQVLRTQTQAYYAPDNLGHFGLALGSYAHFTSPIRRYADLLVHRGLVEAYDLGPGGLSQGEAETFARIGEAISGLERRAMEAERETVDRYVAAYLSQHIGEVMEARITGVRSFGFFASVEGVGGDGLVPARDLGQEYYRWDEAGQRLVGEHSGTAFTIGQRLPLRLAEANPVSGALRFELVDGLGSAGGAPDGGRGPPRVMKRRGRPPNIRHQGRRR